MWFCSNVWQLGEAVAHVEIISQAICAEAITWYSILQGQDLLLQAGTWSNLPAALPTPQQEKPLRHKKISEDLC